MNGFLAIYLRDHHAAGRAGVALVRRTAEAAAEISGALAGIADEIEDDFGSLEQVMAALGIAPSTAKDALAAVGQRVGRLKPNGQVFGRSPLCAVVELEALVAGIMAKEAMWEALVAVGERWPQLEGIDLDHLIERARRQRETVDAYRLNAARAAFAVAT